MATENDKPTTGSATSLKDVDMWTLTGPELDAHFDRAFSIFDVAPQGEPAPPELGFNPELLRG